MKAVRSKRPTPVAPDFNVLADAMKDIPTLENSVRCMAEYQAIVNFLSGETKKEMAFLTENRLLEASQYDALCVGKFLPQSMRVYYSQIATEAFKKEDLAALKAIKADCTQ